MLTTFYVLFGMLMLYGSVSLFIECARFYRASRLLSGGERAAAMAFMVSVAVTGLAGAVVSVGCVFAILRENEVYFL